jgi:hypothetical protein
VLNHVFHFQDAPVKYCNGNKTIGKEGGYVNDKTRLVKT